MGARPRRVRAAPAAGAITPAGDDGVHARLERARRHERDAVAELELIIGRCEELYEHAVHLLASFERSLEARRARLRQLGYPLDGGRSQAAPGHDVGRALSGQEAAARGRREERERVRPSR